MMKILILLLFPFDTIFRYKMKVFICVVILAAIAAAIPVENAQETLTASRALSEQLTAPEPTHMAEDSKTQIENSNRHKRFIFLKLFAPVPVVYAAPAPVVYSAPVVRTVVCF